MADPEETGPELFGQPEVELDGHLPSETEILYEHIQITYLVNIQTKQSITHRTVYNITCLFYVFVLDRAQKNRTKHNSQVLFVYKNQSIKTFGIAHCWIGPFMSRGISRGITFILLCR